MTSHQNETVVRRFFEEVWNKSNKAATKEIVSDQYSSIENQTFSGANGLDVFAADQNLYHGLYKDLSFKIKEMFSHGDTMVVRWEPSGLALNETFTSRNGTLTHKSLKGEGISLVKVKDGKIIEARFFWPRDPLFP
jgi:ketosteroid isomerase-like protein